MFYFHLLIALFIDHFMFQSIQYVKGVELIVEHFWGLQYPAKIKCMGPQMFSLLVHSSFHICPSTSRPPILIKILDRLSICVFVCVTPKCNARDMHQYLGDGWRNWSQSFGNWQIWSLIIHWNHFGFPDLHPRSLKRFFLIK